MTQADSVHSTPRRFTPKIVGGTDVVRPASAPLLPTDDESDPIIAPIEKKRTADVAHGEAIEAQDRYGNDCSEEAWEADERCEEACHFAHDLAWQLARSSPTTLAGIAALLRFANEFEDVGNEWPGTDTIGRMGWHYQLRASIAAAIEAIIRKGTAA
jgi:hypothetical protein